MNRFLENSKYIVIIGVLCLLASSAITFIWGGFQTFNFAVSLIASRGVDTDLVGSLIQLVDTFLVATVLMITSLGLYELFISKLRLPEWLIIDNLTKLKTKLTDVIILILAINFLKFYLKSEDMTATLLNAVAAAVVIAVLIAFGNLRVNDPKGSKEKEKSE